MKTAIDKLRERYQKAADEAQARADMVQAQEEALQGMRQQQEEAAQAEDFERFEALGEQIRQADNRLYVMKHAKPKAETVTKQDAIDAWEEYAKTWTKDQAQLWKDYRKAVSALREKYETLVRNQNTALKTRQEVASMADVEPDELNLEGWLPNNRLEFFPTNHGNLHAPEMDFFGKYEEWTRGSNRSFGGWTYQAEDTLRAVVVRREPVDEPRF